MRAMSALPLVSASVRVAVPVGDGARALALYGVHLWKQWPQLPQPPPPRLSIIMQYYRMSKNIRKLAHWKKCPGVELLVHVDSRDSHDLAWLNTTADRLLFDHNLHEIRGYNALAQLARAPMIGFVQDDMPPPLQCSYIQNLERMMLDDPALAAIGWRTWSMTPMNFRWPGAFGEGNNATMRFERRINTKLNWWNGSSIRAQYAALVDVGPLFLRRAAFHDVGGFNEGFSMPGHNGHYHDWEFSTRLWLSGWRAAFQDTRLSGLSCVCFGCLMTEACKGADPRSEAAKSAGGKVSSSCEKDVAAGTVRMRANYADAKKLMVKQRLAIMARYKRYYENISIAVGRLNTQLAASNGFFPDRGAMVRWRPGPEANLTLFNLTTTVCGARKDEEGRKPGALGAWLGLNGRRLQVQHTPGKLRWDSCCNVFGLFIGGGVRQLDQGLRH